MNPHLTIGGGATKGSVGGIKGEPVGSGRGRDRLWIAIIVGDTQGIAIGTILIDTDHRTTGEQRRIIGIDDRDNNRCRDISATVYQGDINRIFTHMAIGRRSTQYLCRRIEIYPFRTTHRKCCCITFDIVITKYYGVVGIFIYGNICDFS